MDRETMADHLHVVLFDSLNLCGCGQPAAAYEMVRDLLALAPLYEEGRWRLAETLTGGGGGHHIIMSALDAAGLMEHGSSISGAWLTGKGKWCLDAMRQLEYADLSESGYPHGGEDCTDACWV
ncbi:hypothetical protein [Streptomyces goshikiensis]|uniref:hypothetical protein n=1 Tax=Streptomyces goshikiensis TaxID=1942 RepID=UPI002E14B9A5|nr:hypothetical protein OG224_06565 [Streptomyces goshikiensis]